MSAPPSASSRRDTRYDRDVHWSEESEVKRVTNAIEEENALILRVIYMHMDREGVIKWDEVVSDHRLVEVVTEIAAARLKERYTQLLAIGQVRGRMSSHDAKKAKLQQIHRAYALHLALPFENRPRQESLHSSRPPPAQNSLPVPLCHCGSCKAGLTPLDYYGRIRSTLSSPSKLNL
jgi:hypothetical protein